MDLRARDENDETSELVRQHFSRFYSHVYSHFRGVDWGMPSHPATPELLPLGRVPGFSNESVTFCHHFIRMLEKVAPDAGGLHQVGKVPSKRLDG